MDIALKHITVRELYQGYSDGGSCGSVVGYGGKLNIRPEFQREFIYNEKMQRAVITSIVSGFPLNVMYWSVKEDGTYELLDGQQRTMSICRYVDGKFSHDMLFFENKPADIQQKILDYELMVYICNGTDSEKLKWFETINIAGLKLTEQELRNAIFAGPFVSDAKAKLSRPGQGGAAKGKPYINGEADRQEILETAIEWAALPHGWDVQAYMNEYAKAPNAKDLWLYFNAVIDWIEATFPRTDRKLLKGLPWGQIYIRFKDITYDDIQLQTLIDELSLDDDVTSQKGIIPYALAKEGKVLSAKDESGLSIRTFTEAQKRAKYKEQGGICPICQAQGCDKMQYELSEMEADHIKPWSKGGKTELSNCQMLCKFHNNEKKAKW